ncbi:MAG TPA: hypothetical protein VMA31_16660 [Bryobacteraceae bacterium]|jgi:hypothetical protein|nr:hypothetical protein [Bryobacteraceae bacterium]
MPKTVPVIGIQPHELRWLRMLVFLMRHPDPSVPELARQALLYLREAAGEAPEAGREPTENPAPRPQTLFLGQPTL